MPIEIAGDLFRPFIGLVDQTLWTPFGNLMPWKMTRCTLDPESKGVDTPNNAVPGYDTGISAKRKCTGKMEQACFDVLFNIYGFNPNVVAALGAGFAFMTRLKEGMYFRMMCQPAYIEGGPIGIGDVVGVPIIGNAGEVPANLAGTVGGPFTPTGIYGFFAPGTGVLSQYIFLTLRMTKIHHMADAAAGQPFDFDFESVYPYAVPGEFLNVITAYGYDPTPWVEFVNTDGFL